MASNDWRNIFFPIQVWGIDTERLAKDWMSSVMVIYSEGDDGKSLGTGFVLTSDGLIVTNYHVIKGAAKVVAKSFSGGSFPVISVIASDEAHDIAIIMIKTKGLPPVKLGDSTSVKVGAEVATIGNPKGLEHSITEGIVSAIRADSPKGKAIQISAAISPGSSGSPVFTKNREVVGIATFTRVDGQALNFAIPSSRIVSLLSKAKQARATDKAATKGAPFYNPDPSIKGSAEQDEEYREDEKHDEVRNLIGDGDFFGALKIMQELLKSYPESVSANRHMSVAYSRVGMDKEALTMARKALDLDPENTKNWDVLAKVFESLGQGKTAKEVYQDAVKIAPDDVALLINYGLLMSDESPKLAHSLFKHAGKLILENKDIAIGSNLYVFAKNLLKGFWEVNRADEGYKFGEAFLQKNTESADSWMVHAYACFYFHKYEEIQSSLRKAAKLDKGLAQDYRFHRLWAESKMGLGDEHEAYVSFSKVIELNPDFTAVHTAAYTALIVIDLNAIINRRGNYTDARHRALIEHLNQLSKLDKEEGKAWHDKARSALAREGYDFP